MKLLVIGDTHGNTSLIKELVQKYPDMDFYLHTGDSELDPSSIAPFISVKGNCDYYPFDQKYFLRTPFGHIFMRHYPYIINEDAEEVDFFIHGHTHVAKIKKEENLLILSPGSLVLPRDGTNGTYMIIHLDECDKYIDVIDVFSKKIITHYKIM